MWKQPECLSTHAWIKKLICTYSGMLLSHKKNEILPFSSMGELGGYYYYAY